MRLEPPRDWPRLGDGAFHGLAGEIVRAIEPHTEADPAGILVQLLVCFGSVLGRRPHFRVESDRHGLNLYCVLVGETSKARKGTSAGHVFKLFSEVDPGWRRSRVQTGMSSGEGLIWAVRDPQTARQARRGPDGAAREQLADPGVADKRLLVYEPELSSTLRVLRRDGNTLSPVLRSAWDSGRLQILTRHSPATASGAHVSVVAHITRSELAGQLDQIEIANGFANRFLWISVRRSKLLPEGGRLEEVHLAPMVAKLREAIAHGQRVEELQRTEDASRLWRDVYPDLSAGRAGLYGALTARGEAHVLRLAGLYALLDRSSVIGHEHLAAALALWRYAREATRYIFEDTLGIEVQVLKELCRAEEGMTRTQLLRCFNNHLRGAELEEHLRALERERLAECEQVATGGRPAEVWRAT